jgi:elongation factor Ts
MAVDMNLLKQLRDTTFAPMKDCKEALDNAGGDLDAAMEYLKKKWAAQAAKKADRETNEGAIKTRMVDNTVYAIKMACETDFVAKNDLFVELTGKLLDAVTAHKGNVDSLSALPAEIATQCEWLVSEFVGKIWENIKLADVYIHNAEDKAVIYVHPGDKLVAVVYYSAAGDNAEAVAKQAALQIAAMNPEYLSVDTVPADQRSALTAQFTEEVAASGKPADIVEKIVAGKLDKAYSENVLLEQAAIWDDSKKVKDYTNGQASISSFVRIAI